MTQKVKVVINASVHTIDPIDYYLDEEGNPLSIEEIRDLVDEDALQILTDSYDSYWDVDVEFVEVDE